MPAGNGTGPFGQGPRTGRGRGGCNPSDVDVTNNQTDWIGGRGSFGRGTGNRRGFGRRGFGFPGFGSAPAPDREKKNDES